MTEMPTDVTQQNAPVPLIVIAWGAVIFSFFPVSAQLGEIGMILLSLGTLALGIILIVNKNRTAKIHGIIITVIWVLTFCVGFGVGLSQSGVF